MLAAGHQVRRQNLSKMHFDPILCMGYTDIQQLEPPVKVTRIGRVRYLDEKQRWHIENEIARLD